VSASTNLPPLKIDFAIDPQLVQSLTSLAYDDAICAEFPLAAHVRQRLKTRAELRWIQAVARRESLPLSPQAVAEAVELKRPPLRFKEAAVSVRRLEELQRKVRILGALSRPDLIGPEHLESFHELLAGNGPDAGHYRTAPRRPYFLSANPEFVPLGMLPQAVAGVFTWLNETELGQSDVIGVAIAHQELMLLTPFREFTPAVVDAVTRILLMRRLVNRHGLAVVEQIFAGDMNEYQFLIHDRSDGGRARWARYFIDKLGTSVRVAAREVLDLRQHVEREPWLDAAPLNDREQIVYTHLLRTRKATSQTIMVALGAQATSLRMGQRTLSRLGELELIEKVGSRKDAWYRPVGWEEANDEKPATAAPKLGSGVRR
jgi:hypothetical protein